MTPDIFITWKFNNHILLAPKFTNNHFKESESASECESCK